MGNNNAHTTDTTNHQPAPRRPGLVATAAVIVGLALGAVAGPAAASDSDTTWTAPDAGSLGVTAGPDQTWCLVDAGSLGVPDPLSVCAG